MIKIIPGTRLPQILAILALVVFSALTVRAQVPPPTGPELSKEPIHIEADRMESDQKTEAVVFVGNVEARQGDLLIQAARMTVYYQKPATGAGGQAASGEAARAIDKLLATGGVKIVRENWVATGNQLEYLSGDRKIILTGDTKVWQNNNLVTGDRIVLYLDQGKSVVEKNNAGQGERVKAFFYPDTATGKKP
jgi:lipopolysaccharide export system protein LptA